MITTADEGTGPKLNLSEEFTGDEEGGEPKDDNGSVEALAKGFKAQRWDADRPAWKEPATRERDHPTNCHGRNSPLPPGMELFEHRRASSA